MTDAELRQRFETGAIVVRSSTRQTRRDAWVDVFTLDDEDLDAEQARRALKGVPMRKRLTMHARLSKGGSMFCHEFTHAKPDESEPA